MGLRGNSKIVQSGHAKTQYISIPADIVSDSQYPFKSGDEVEIIVIPSRKEIKITLKRKGVGEVEPVSEVKPVKS